MSRRHLSRGFSTIEILVVIIVLGVILAMILPAIGAARGQARKASCRNNLKQLGTSMMTYNTTVGGNKVYPDGKGAECLILMYRAGTLMGKSNEIYICPTSGDKNEWDRLPDPKAASDAGGRQCSYAGRDNVTYGPVTDNLDPGTVIASDDFEGTVNHADGVNVLKFDWSVQWFDKRATGINPAAKSPAEASGQAAAIYRLDTLAN